MSHSPHNSLPPVAYWKSVLTRQIEERKRQLDEPTPASFSGGEKKADNRRKRLAAALAKEQKELELLLKTSGTRPLAITGPVHLAAVAEMLGTSWSAIMAIQRKGEIVFEGDECAHQVARDEARRIVDLGWRRLKLQSKQRPAGVYRHALEALRDGNLKTTRFHLNRLWCRERDGVRLAALEIALALTEGRMSDVMQMCRYYRSSAQYHPLVWRALRNIIQPMNFTDPAAAKFVSELLQINPRKKVERMELSRDELLSRAVEAARLLALDPKDRDALRTLCMSHVALGHGPLLLKALGAAGMDVREAFALDATEALSLSAPVLEGDTAVIIPESLLPPPSPPQFLPIPASYQDYLPHETHVEWLGHRPNFRFLREGILATDKRTSKPKAKEVAGRLVAFVWLGESATAGAGGLFLRRIWWASNEDLKAVATPPPLAVDAQSLQARSLSRLLPDG